MKPLRKEMTTEQTHAPGEHQAIDLHFFGTKGKSPVIYGIDLASKFLSVGVCMNKTGDEMVTKYKKYFINPLGPPGTVHMDNGPE